MQISTYGPNKTFLLVHLFSPSYKVEAICADFTFQTRPKLQYAKKEEEEKRDRKDNLLLTYKRDISLHFYTISQRKRSKKAGFTMEESYDIGINIAVVNNFFSSWAELS